MFQHPRDVATSALVWGDVAPQRYHHERMLWEGVILGESSSDSSEVSCLFGKGEEAILTSMMGSSNSADIWVGVPENCIVFPLGVLFPPFFCLEV
ncbi:hypothetical protein CEXT_120131 [Caerostris extrusa]|uniref:Uncharacterized protein n=1 Tax=Caerostris extrusa TaxID=172846 RepID=A0AAV4XQR9_CAEEX|nr:hypothetical protein CEXT_120131 [Caerostris extrusa]